MAPLPIVEFKAPIAAYQEGGTLRLTSTIRDHEGIQLPATRIRLLILPPEESESEEHMLRQEGSAAVALIALTVPGLWRYRLESLATPQAVYEGAFHVIRRLVPAPE